MKTFKALSNLKGRRALITGGAGHIGSVAAETLVELGATVGLLDWDAKKLKEEVARLDKMKAHSAFGLACDLHHEEEIRATAAQGASELGGLDILIHCAGYVGTSKTSGWRAPFKEQTVVAWEKALKVNLTSAFVLAQVCSAFLEVSGHGSIILFSSIHGIVAPQGSMYEGTPMTSPVGYGVTKGGLLQLTKILAAELAPRVRVNAISPGGIWRGQPERFHERYKQQTPLKRMGTEEDMKGAVAFLASDLSQYVTGQNIVIDGGYTAW